MQREINYTRKPLTYGNSCKVNASFNKGAHPHLSLFEESSVHLKTSQTIGKIKETKQAKRSRQKLPKTVEKNQQTKKPKLSDPCRPKWTWV